MIGLVIIAMTIVLVLASVELYRTDTMYYSTMAGLVFVIMIAAMFWDEGTLELLILAAIIAGVLLIATSPY